MTLWELINPSDKYTFITDDFEVASAFVLIVGRGEYGAQEIGGERRCPIMLFGLAEKWAQENFGKPVEKIIEDVLATKKHALIECAESLVIGNRKLFDMAIEAIPTDSRKSFMAKWQDENKSSMNDIGGVATELAKILRAAP